MDFANELISWYTQHKRDLPWRHTTDPYVLWLSEIILQQTRVEQGMPYFYRFLEHYPTVAHFARATEGEILKDWQGLGYYSRARNMHHTAQVVMQQFGGQFPSNYAALISLKGIGEYTAAAISSFAANEDQVVVDGNVFRLLARYFGLDTPINSSRGKKQFTELAQSLLPKGKAGLFNQALMEFGSLQCKPTQPLCETCPLQSSCFALSAKKVNQLPVKVKKQPVRERFFNYVVALRGTQIALQQRGAGDIWQGLYEFPLLESQQVLSPEQLLQHDWFRTNFGDTSRIEWVHGPVKHLLSHQRIFAQFVVLQVPDTATAAAPWQFVSLDAAEKLAKPKLIFEFLIKLITFIRK